MAIYIHMKQMGKKGHPAKVSFFIADGDCTLEQHIKGLVKKVSETTILKVRIRI